MPNFRRFLRLESLRQQVTSLHVSLFFFFLSLLLAEFSVSFDLQYTSVVFVPFLSPCLIYGGLGLGQLVSCCLPRTMRQWISANGWIPAALIMLLFKAISINQIYVIPVSLLVFVPYGMVSAWFYETLPFGAVLFPATAAGIAVTLSVFSISSMDTEYLKVAAVVLLAFSYLAQAGNLRRVRAWAHAAMVVLVACAMRYPLVPQIAEAINRIQPVLKSYGKTYFAPFIRTDIYYHTGLYRYFLVTNGNFMARIANDLDENVKFKFLSPGHGGRALVIGSAGGRNLLSLRRSGFDQITAVDINPNVFTAVRENFAQSSRHVYDLPGIEVVAQDGRRFLRQTDKQFDLIVIERVVTGGRSGDFGEYFESFIYTQEALRSMLKHLDPAGTIYINEYRTYRRGSNDPKYSLAQKIETTARCMPELKDASIRRVVNQQDAGSSFTPNVHRQMETVTISRLPSPIGAGVTDTANVVCQDSLTDDRPWFSSSSWNYPEFGALFCGIFALILSVMVAFCRFRQIPHALARLAAGAGIVYMLWILGISGLLSLILPLPTQVAPATLGLSFLAGLFNYFIYPRNFNLRWASALGLAFGLVLVMWLRTGAPSWQVGSGISLLGFGLALIPCFIFVEIPYIFAVMSKGNRLNVVFLENLGSVLGIMIGFVLKVIFGYSVVAVAALVLGAGLIYFTIAERNTGRS